MNSLRKAIQTLLLGLSSALLLLSCGDGGADPAFNVVGFRFGSWVTSGDTFEGAQEDTTHTRMADGDQVFIFDEDGTFRWFVRLSATRMELFKEGQYRVSKDSLYMTDRGGEVFAYSMFKYLSIDEWIVFCWTERQHGDGEERRFFLRTDEIREARSVAARYGRHLMDSLGLVVPKERRRLHPDIFDAGLYAGEKIGMEGGDTIRYGCLWDVRADSTIVEYLMNGRARTRRTYAYDVVWDPGDVYDTIVLRSRRPAERRLRLYETSPYLSAWNTGADGYRLTSTRHDEQAARDARQMLAFDDYVEE